MPRERIARRLHYQRRARAAPCQACAARKRHDSTPGMGYKLKPTVRPLCTEGESMSTVVQREDHDSGVSVLTLNRPEARNPLGAQVRDALTGHLRQLEFDPQVRCVVLRGAGGHFCSGGDIKTMGETDPIALAQRMDAMRCAAMMIGCFPKPLLAAVAGHAAGAGVSLACLSDLIVAQHDARFTVSFLRIGLGPDYGLSHTLALRIGAAAARRMMMTRETMPADEAYRVGLVDVLCDDGTLMRHAMEQAERLAHAAPEAMQHVKRMMIDRDALAAALDAEAYAQRQRFMSAEHHEGIAAFLQKRPPRFTPPARS